MSRKTWYILWAVLFALCAGCGFIPKPAGAVRAILTALGLLFFVPGIVLLMQKNPKDQQIIFRLSAVSLLLTAVLLIFNFLSLGWPRWAGNLVYGLLVIGASPMVCIGPWILSLFLWACLMIAAKVK